MIEFEVKTAQELLEWALGSFGDRFAVVTSFQSEGMAVLDMAVRISSRVRVLTVDTGRLPEATHRMIETVHSRYGVNVEVITPNEHEISAMVAQHGLNLFERDVSLRRLCCQIRKVRPLEDVLEGFDAWAVGLRRSQSDSRKEVPKAEQVGGRWKLSPLADWSKQQLDKYIAEYNVPQHPLYARGYTSIGCDPCTRAVEPGEDERAGRWWWEQDAVKECGIHFSPSGKIERTVDVLLSEVLAH